MTVTVVYGDVADGYLQSSDASYANARNGPADSVHASSTVWYGQNANSGYGVLQGFIRFTYPALPAGSVLTSAVLKANSSSQLSPGVTRDLEYRGAPWGTSLELADWRTPAQLASAGLFARVAGVQASSGKVIRAGSDLLLAQVASVTFLEFVLVSSRQRAGSTPTTDEGSALYSAIGGSSLDPALVYTTTSRHALHPVLGASAQLSDGSWVMLTSEAEADPTVTLRHRRLDGTTATVGAIPLTTGAGDGWLEAAGAQGLSLAVDSSDTIYVAGVQGTAPGSARVQAWIKAGASWSPAAAQTVALPAHDAALNQVALAWHSTAGGTLVVLGAHTAGAGQAGGSAQDISWALVRAAGVLTGIGTLVRATGSALGTLLPSGTLAAEFGGYANETGTGLDLVADRSQPDVGYLVSFKRSQALGANSTVGAGRYVLASTGDAFASTGFTEPAAWGRKDAATKVRVLSTGSGQVVVLTADPDPGYGVTALALQVSGGSFVALGAAYLSGEEIPSMPDGPAMSGTPAWDAIYSSGENAVWIYYVDVADPARVLRTSFSLNTYQATRVEEEVYVAAGPVQAIRVPRAAWTSTVTTVDVAHSGTWVQVTDIFNLAPTAPGLTPRANFDATTAATFAWTFQDPNAGDAQTAYQLQIIRTSDGVTVLDTGKVLSATTSRNVTGGTLVNGESYRWRVMTWDGEDLASPWSDFGTFSTSAGGTVTITDPSVDNPPGVITDDYLVTWAVAGTVQTSFRAWVTRGDTGATVYDSGQVVSGATSHLVANMVSDVEHTVRVQVWNASAVPSGVGSRLITPSYSSPEVPVISLAAVPDGGYVLVTVDNPAPTGDRPEVARNRVLRRRAGSTDPWEELGECEPDGTFRDYTAAGLVPLEYMVRGEA